MIEWILDPFVYVPYESPVSALEEDQLLEITNDGGLKSMFKITSPLLTFWIKIRVEDPENATKILENPDNFQNLSL